MNTPYFGACMKAARKKLGMTQEDLAKQLGVATITVRQYESGSREPKLETLKNIAQILNLDPILFFNEIHINETIDASPYYAELINTILAHSNQQDSRKNSTSNKKLEVFKAAAQLSGFSINRDKKSYQLHEISTGDILAKNLSDEEITKATTCLIDYAGALCVQLSDFYKKYTLANIQSESTEDHRKDDSDSDAVPDSGEETPAGK